MIRDVPKPVIAKVRGYAIGGGHVLALLCDLTLAAESAKFGQGRPQGRFGGPRLRHRLHGAGDR